ncbi:MAG: hypothetical protein ACF8PN_13080 [Phycisphaerales bacterium]
MTNRPTEPPTLPGPTPVASSAASERGADKAKKTPGPRQRPWLRRGTAFIMRAMLAQPILTFALMAGVWFIGLGSLWSMTPMWRVETPVVLRGDDDQNLNATWTAAAHPEDMASYLTAPTVRAAVAERLGERTGESAAERGLPPVRAVVASAWRSIASAPASFVAWVAGSEREVESIPLHVQVTPSDEGRTVQLVVWASSPTRAELAPDLLADEVARRLIDAERTRLQRRIDERRPVWDAAEERFARATSDYAEFEARVAQQDPAAYAAQLEEQLSTRQSELDALETEVREAEARRLSVIRQMDGTPTHTTGEVVETDNPRIRELETVIGQLEEEFASKLSRLTEEHPEMKALRGRIDERRRELADLKEEKTVVQTIRRPNPQYQEMQRRRMQLDSLLNELAAREVGLEKIIERLSSDLAESSDLARTNERLTRELDEATTEVKEIRAERERLEAARTSEVNGDLLRVLAPPRVRDTDRPDSPNVAAHVTTTIVLSLLLGAAVPSLLAAWRWRIVADWQLEELGEIIPLQMAGALPARSSRRLLTSPKGAAT